MKRTIILIAVALLAGSAFAADDMATGVENVAADVGQGTSNVVNDVAKTVGIENKVGITLEATYMSKYLWNGYDVYDDKSAFEGKITFDIADTGWYAGVGYITIGSTGNVYNNPAASAVGLPAGLPAGNMPEYDFFIGYKKTYFEAETYQADIDLNYMYHNVGSWPSKYNKFVGGSTDFQELSLYTDLPGMTFFGIVPHAKALYTWGGWDGGSDGGYYSAMNAGWILSGGLKYDWAFAGFSDNTPEQVISIFGDVVYDDGVLAINNKNGGSQKSNWTHWVVGATSDFKIGPGTLTPGIYYQSAFAPARKTTHVGTSNDTVVSDDLYCTVTYSLSF